VRASKAPAGVAEGRTATRAVAAGKSRGRHTGLPQAFPGETAFFQARNRPAIRAGGRRAGRIQHPRWRGRGFLHPQHLADAGFVRPVRATGRWADGRRMSRSIPSRAHVRLASVLVGFAAHGSRGFRGARRRMRRAGLGPRMAHANVHVAPQPFRVMGTWIRGEDVEFAGPLGGSRRPTSCRKFSLRAPASVSAHPRRMRQFVHGREADFARARMAAAPPPTRAENPAARTASGGWARCRRRGRELAVQKE